MAHIEDQGRRRRENLRDARLYVCVTARRERGDLREFLHAAYEGGTDIIQLRDKTLETCDRVVRIPFAADFGSLNVSNAAAVALYAAATG